MEHKIGKSAACSALLIRWTYSIRNNRDSCVLGCSIYHIQYFHLYHVKAIHTIYIIKWLGNNSINWADSGLRGPQSFTTRFISIYLIHHTYICCENLEIARLKQNPDLFNIRACLYSEWKHTELPLSKLCIVWNLSRISVGFTILTLRCFISQSLLRRLFGDQEFRWKLFPKSEFASNMTDAGTRLGALAS